MVEENKEQKQEPVTPKGGSKPAEGKSSLADTINIAGGFSPEEDISQEEPKVEKQADTKVKKEEEKVETKNKRTEAVVNGTNLRISTKHSIAVCNFIRNKDIDEAIKMLQEAEKMKKPIPMRGEIPHRKGIMSGRYPINAIKEFIVLLKSLKANALVNELELEKVKIACKANLASRPYKRFGRGKMKRTHVELKLIKREKAKKRAKKK